MRMTWQGRPCSIKKSPRRMWLQGMVTVLGRYELLEPPPRGREADTDSWMSTSMCSRWPPWG